MKKVLENNVAKENVKLSEGGMKSLKKSRKAVASRTAKTLRKASCAKTAAERTTATRLIRSAPKSGRVKLSAIAKAVKSVSSKRCES